MKTRIIIFAKAPLAGFAKTRLIPAMGASGAAELARHMLLHTVKAALSSEADTVELCMTPHPHDEAWAQMSLPKDLILTDQGSGDLGERLARAAQRGLSQNEAVLLIGTDCPSMDAEELSLALAALLQNSAVLIPTFDGGYALLGLRRFEARLFQDIRWSTDHVFQETLERIKALNWSFTLRPMLHDIDEPDDLHWLPECFSTNGTL